MKKLLIALAAACVAVATYGQGQVVFANRVTGVLDAPVTMVTDPNKGPGETWTAELFLSDAAGTSLTPLAGGTSAFRKAGTGTAAIADRYWNNITVDVPTVAPGGNATFVVGAYPTALGSLTAAKAANAFGVSSPFTVAVGGGTLPPANLTTLTAFTVNTIPEPSVIALGVLGASAFLLRRRK